MFKLNNIKRKYISKMFFFLNKIPFIPTQMKWKNNHIIILVYKKMFFFSFTLQATPVSLILVNNVQVILPWQLEPNVFIQEYRKRKDLENIKIPFYG